MPHTLGIHRQQLMHMAPLQLCSWPCQSAAQAGDSSCQQPMHARRCPCSAEKTRTRARLQRQAWCASKQVAGGRSHHATAGSATSTLGTCSALLRNPWHMQVASI